MSSYTFNISRDTNNKIIKTPITVNTSPIVNIVNTVTNSVDNSFIVADTLSIGGIDITTPLSTVNNLLSDLTPGVVQSDKLVLLDASKNIEGFNDIVCDVLEVNGENITTNPVAAQDDSTNPFLTDITPGTITGGKAMVVDANRNIGTSLEIETNKITINGKTLRSNTNDNSVLSIYKTNKYHTFDTKMIPDINTSIYPYEYGASSSFFTGFSAIPSIERILWIDELSLYVAVGFTSGTNMIVSYDSIRWANISPFSTRVYSGAAWSPSLSKLVICGTTYQAHGSSPTSLAEITVSGTYKDVCWSEELGLFCMIGNSICRTSPDGAVWIAQTIPAKAWVKIIWAKKLNKFITISTTTSVNSIAYSSNGIDWSSATHLSDGFRSITYNDYYGCVIAASYSTTTNNLLISYDGINFKIATLLYCDPTTKAKIQQIKWIDELRCYMALVIGSTSSIMCSPDGYQWSALSVNQNNVEYSDIEYSPIYNTFIIGTNLTTFKLIRIGKVLSNNIDKVHPGMLKSQICSSNNINNFIGIGTSTPTKQLEIYSASTKMLRFVKKGTSNYLAFDLNSAGLTVSSTGTSPGINIPHDAINSLYLNNTKLTPSVAELNAIANLSYNNGIAVPKKILVTSSNNDVSNINVLSCSSLTVNGSSIDPDSVSINSSIRGIVPGIAQANKAIITDINDSCNTINTSNTNRVELSDNNMYLSKSKNNLNVNLSIMNGTKDKKEEFPPFDLFINNINTSTTSIASFKICASAWSPTLRMIVLVGNIGYYSYSYNGITWNTGTMFGSISAVADYPTTMTWSPHHKMFLALSKTYVFFSYNGINWNIRNLILSNGTISAMNSLIWIDELKIYVAVGGHSTASSSIIVSTDGFYWKAVSNSSTVAISNTFRSVVWASSLKMMVAIADTTYPSISKISYSYDGYIWYHAIQNSAQAGIGWLSITWSPKLKMFITATSGSSTGYRTRNLYSYNGINWFGIQDFVDGWYNLWIDEYEVFVTLPSNNNAVAYSYDGFNWIQGTNLPTNAQFRGQYIGELGTFIIYRYDSASMPNLFTFKIQSPNMQSPMCSPDSIQTSEYGNLGIGLTPTHLLTVSTEEVYKTTNNSWTISSDMRLKNDIQPADLDRCYDIVNLLRLVEYEYKAKSGRHLGWIADEVEQYFPKAIDIVNLYGLSDCKTLNSDQIVAVLYGTIKKLINNYESNAAKINEINQRIQNL